MERSVSKKVSSKVPKKMNSFDDGFDDYGGGDQDDMDIIAEIFTLFATGLVPGINKEIARDICKTALLQGGIGTHNATLCGKMVQRTAFGARSNAKH